MSELISKLKALDIPVHSPIAAIQFLNGRSDMTKEQYEGILNDFTGDLILYDSLRTTKYTFLYFIQNIIKSSFNTDCANLSMMLDESHNQAVKYIKENQWVFAAEDNPANATTRLDVNGKPKRKKGQKQIEAARIYKENKENGKKIVIGLFMSELDMSKAGATTYFYNCKKKFGE